MQYFNKKFIDFFKSLSRNNSKEWFDQNRPNYELNVKKPFERFITDMIDEISKQDPSVKMSAKEAIFRINKDIRFSKDKSPYKTSMSAAISAGGRNPESPGIYVELSHEKLTIVGGCYVVEKDNLLKIRKYIGRHTSAFQKIISEKKFKNSFGSILGEKSKTPPPDLGPLIAKEPLIANKQFYFAVDLPVSSITKSNLLRMVVKYFQLAKPLNDFLTQAITKP